MRFENLFTRSLRIAWRKPWLWFLALLAGETYGGGGGSSGLSDAGGSFPGPGPASTNGFALPDLSWVPGWLQDRAGPLLEIAAVLVAAGFLLFLLSCVASGALVGAAARIDAGERVGFGQGWRIGLGSFWRVLGFKLVQILLLLLAPLILLLPPLLGAAGWGGAGLIRGLLLDLPVAVAAFFWASFVGALALLGLRACVLDGTGPIASYTAAFGLLRRRFSRIALTALLFVAVGFGAGVALQLVLTVAAAPFSGSIVNEVLNGRWSEALLAAEAELAVLVPLTLLLSSAVGAYFATAWTVAYRRFDSEGEVPEPAPLAV
jgi:hypothetical protein